MLLFISDVLNESIHQFQPSPSNYIYIDTSSCCSVKTLLLTQDPDTMSQGLHTARLHGHAEHRLLPTDGANLVFLGSLLEHDHELVGNDGVEHRNDDHGKHEGDERVDLRRRNKAWSKQGNGQQGRRLWFISHSKSSSLQWKHFPFSCTLPLLLKLIAQRESSDTTVMCSFSGVNTQKRQIHSHPIMMSFPFQGSSFPEVSWPKGIIIFLSCQWQDAL